MNSADVAIAISVIAVAATLYQVYLAWRARRKDKMRAEISGDRVVVQSALELLKPYKEQVAELRKDLANAESQIESLTAKLFEAQSELTTLRRQIKNMSSEFGDDGKSEKA